MKRLVFAFMTLLAAVCASAEKSATRFVWGADAGASIDLTGIEMRPLDFKAVFGMSRVWINYIGNGASADIMVRK